jgi:hypothetical protein
VIRPRKRTTINFEVLMQMVSVEILLDEVLKHREQEILRVLKIYFQHLEVADEEPIGALNLILVTSSETMQKHKDPRQDNKKKHRKK